MFEHFPLQEKRMIFAKKMNKRKKEEEKKKIKSLPLVSSYSFFANLIILNWLRIDKKNYSKLCDAVVDN